MSVQTAFFYPDLRLEKLCCTKTETEKQIIYLNQIFFFTPFHFCLYFERETLTGKAHVTILLVILEQGTGYWNYF